MKNIYKQYKAISLMGLLILNILSSCVNTRQVSGINLKPVTAAAAAAAAAAAVGSGVSGYPTHNVLNGSIRSNHVITMPSNYFCIPIDSTTDSILPGNTTAGPINFPLFMYGPNSSNYEESLKNASFNKLFSLSIDEVTDCKDVLSDKPKEDPVPLNAFGDRIDHQKFQGMNINKVLLEISEKPSDLKMIKCWVKRNDNERLSLKMRNDKGQTLPMLIFPASNAYEINDYQIFKILDILLRSEDFNWDHTDSWNNTFIDYLNLYVEDNPSFKKFAKKLVKLKKQVGLNETKLK